MGLSNRTNECKRECQSSNTRLQTTRDVLKEHLYAKIRNLQPGKEDFVFEQLVKEVDSDQSIIKLLCDSELLQQRIEKCQLGAECSGTEELGELLFPKVALLDSELCAQITGMLLELKNEEIKRLLEHPSDLALAVAKAKVEYIRYTQEKTEISCISSTENTSLFAKLDLEKARNVLGESLFSVISQKYPLHASQLTGMLLEMDCDALINLLDSPSDLEEKIDLAYNALRAEPESPNHAVSH